MTIKYEGEPIRRNPDGWPIRIKGYKNRGFFGRLFKLQPKQANFYVSPEEGKPGLPNDRVSYSFSLWYGDEVVLRGPEINNDSLCGQNGITWEPSNSRQKKWLAKNNK